MKVGGIEYEIVRKTPTRRGYIRRKPDRTPTPKQLRNMLTFGKAAYNSYGEKENKKIPVAALAVREEFKKKREEEFEQRYLDLFRKEERRIPPIEEIEFKDAIEKVKFLQI